MKRLYLVYSDDAIWRQAVAKIARADSESLIWPQAVAKLEECAPVADFLRQLVAEIPWGHSLLILNNVVEPAARLYYIRATAQLGWSRKVLLNQIKAGAYERAAKEKKTHNFALALPEHFAEQADERMKSRYNLEFLGIGRAVKERELIAEKTVVYRYHDLLAVGQSKGLPGVVDDLKMVAVAFDREGGAVIRVFDSRV